MNEKTEQIYQERIKRLMTASDHQEADRVPIVSLMDAGWPISYKNSTIPECLKNTELEKEIFKTTYDELHLDSAKHFGFNRNLEFYDIMGACSFKLSKNGTALVHPDDYSLCCMEQSDYPDFIKNPVDFLDNQFFIRKFESLRRPYPQNKEILKKAIINNIKFTDKKTSYIQYAREEIGLPMMAIYGTSLGPLEIIFDYLRGFKPTLKDIRQVPEFLEQAIEAVTPFITYASTEGIEKKPAFPWKGSPVHIPLFLSPGQFGKFYWPSFKKILMALYDQGIKVLIALEGSFERFYEFLQELPKSFFIATEFESTEFIPAKKKIGDTIVLCGGMPMDLLKYGKRNECIEYTKKLFDECAPGGGFLFTIDHCIMLKSDINVENYIAVNEFALNYGKY